MRSIDRDRDNISMDDVVSAAERSEATIQRLKTTFVFCFWFRSWF